MVLAALGAAIVAGCSPSADLPAGEKVVAAFHKQLNDGDFGDIYAKSTSAMRAAGSQADMSKFLGAVHRKLGLFKSGKSVGWRDNVTTGGHILVLTYDSLYEHGRAEETFTLRFDSEKPSLEGYHINSQAFVLN
jgi:hypothetical protein